MRMRHIAVIAALALVSVPAGALAAKPSHPVTPANTNANGNANGTTTTTSKTNNGSSVNVLFVLRGKVTSYTAGSSVVLTLKGANHERSALLPGSSFTAMLDANTKVVLHDGAAVAAGDMVVVKIRAAKNVAASTLATTAASRLVDQGKPAAA
jgi:hypothetical protein